MMTNGVQNCFKRVEKKYLLTPDQYRRMRWGMAAHVEPDRYAGYTICNLYYDTDDFRLIRTSLEKPVYKEKLRVRSYGVPGDTDRVFIELKKKYEGVVYKRRVVMDADAAARYLRRDLSVNRDLSPCGAEPSVRDASPMRNASSNRDGHPEQDHQILREIDYFMDSYDPEARVFIAYDREAWAGIETPDLRVTFDTGLRWRDTRLDLRDGDGGAPILDGDQILMELKIPGAAPLWLARLLSENGIFPTSFSKYGTWYKRFVLGAGQETAVGHHDAPFLTVPEPIRRIA